MTRDYLLPVTRGPIKAQPSQEPGKRELSFGHLILTVAVGTCRVRPVAPQTSLVYLWRGLCSFLDEHILLKGARLDSTRAERDSVNSHRRTHSHPRPPSSSASRPTNTSCPLAAGVYLYSRECVPVSALSLAGRKNFLFSLTLCYSSPG